MASVPVTKREITIRAVLDLLPSDVVAQLDEIVAKINALPQDPAIFIDAADIERRVPEAKLPRLPKGWTRPEPGLAAAMRHHDRQYERDPPGGVKRSQGRGPWRDVAVFRDVLLAFEEGAWMFATEIVRDSQRSGLVVRKTMERFLRTTDLFQVRQAVNPTTQREETQYKLVRGRLQKYLAELERSTEVTTPRTPSGRA